MNSVLIIIMLSIKSSPVIKKNTGKLLYETFTDGLHEQRVTKYLHT